MRATILSRFGSCILPHDRPPTTVTRTISMFSKNRSICSRRCYDCDKCGAHNVASISVAKMTRNMNRPNTLLPSLVTMTSTADPNHLITRQFSTSTPRYQIHETSADQGQSQPLPLRSPDEQDIAAFRDMLRDEHDLSSSLSTSTNASVLTDSEDIQRYNTDWTKHYQGTSSIVLRPKSTEEVSSILAYCHEHRIGVVPQAGNTGLVGGGVPLHNTPTTTTTTDDKDDTSSSREVILSVERMKDILSWNATTGILTGQAGGILQDWQNYARDHCGVILPIDLGSKGSCCIGGTVSTNAGGQYYARYKSLHANVVGLEVVAANGDILRFNLNEMEVGTSGGSSSSTNNKNVICNLKDNTGYDMKHLFIGAEGSLGVITKVALWCSSSYPASRCAVLCACTSLDQVEDCLHLARRVLGETLSAFEFMDLMVTRLVANNPNNTSISASHMIPKRPSSTTTNSTSTSKDDNDFYPYYILVETHGSNTTHNEEKMQTFLEASIDQELVEDGVLAQDLTQVEALWTVRESCNPTVASHGYTFKYDVSLPMADFEGFANEMRERLESMCTTKVVATNWGHIMDGNLHFNVTTPGEFESIPEVLETLEPYIFESVIRRGGSISAEHGLGQTKHKYLPIVHDTATLLLMRSIKQLLDPHGIMNPGKYLPPLEHL